MDATDAVKNEVFRPLMSVVIPGALGVAPFVIVAQYYFPQILQFWHDHDAAFTALVIAVMLAAGLLFEDAGALLEEHVVDETLERRHPGHRAQWRQYLKLKIRDEYVGQRYLRSIVTRLKFELSMVPSVASLWIGLAWLQVLYSAWSSWAFAGLSAAFVLLIYYLLVEAYFSAKVLLNTRKLLLEACEPSQTVAPVSQRALEQSSDL